MNHLDWRGCLLAVLSLSLCFYGSRKCIDGFQRTRGSGTFKPAMYVLGLVVLLGIALVVLLAMLYLFVGPIH